MIRLENITKTYAMGSTEVRALRGVSLEIAQGEFIAIMGPSGSGKSTLMHILGCLDTPDAGHYFFDGADISNLAGDQLAFIRNRQIGFIFQNFSLLSRNTALENVELPMIYGSRPDRAATAARLLASVGLAERVHHKPSELSGGQQQRVAIARSLANGPRILFADEPTGNLDLASGKEIMQIIRGLNDQGITTVLVTHDAAVASYARRVIVINDGRIVSDERRADSRPGEHTPAPAPRPARTTGPWFNVLEMFDGIKMAVSGLIANKMRSILAMLGVIIGVSAVIVMISIAQGAKKDITGRIQSMGSNLLTVMSARTGSGASRVAGAIGGTTGITTDDVTAIRTAGAVSKIAPTYTGGAQAVAGNRNTSTRVCGTWPDYLAVRNFTVAYGRNFTEKELRARARVAVLGNSVTEELFGADTDPVGETIKIGAQRFTVIGALAAKGSGAMGDEDNQIIIPLTTAQKRLFGTERISDVNIQITSQDAMESAKEEITALLRKRHRLREGDENDFRVRSQAEILSMVSSTTKTFSLLLGGIASVSLLVGGIGIMNIMLVSVTERTREIGIRKAVGAKARDILTQFLVEALVICVIGGGIGVLTGVLASAGISALGSWSTAISPLSIVISFSFALIIGIIFGIYPAMNAARLNPIRALRYE